MSRLTRKEKKAEYNKKWREDNKEKIAEYKKAQYAANREERREYQKKFRETNKETIKLRAAVRTYGITTETAANLYSSSCSICGTTENICIDHCHTTGNVRGALCHSCNTGIGFFKDCPDLLTKAKEYLSD